MFSSPWAGASAPLHPLATPMDLGAPVVKLYTYPLNQPMKLHTVLRCIVALSLTAWLVKNRFYRDST